MTSGSRGIIYLYHRNQVDELLSHNIGAQIQVSNKLPMPKYIPIPSHEQRKKLAHVGIHLNGYVDDLFTRYKLPNGWRIINDSKCHVTLSFYIIDKRNNIRVIIYGSWIDHYNNDLRIRVLEGDQIVKFSVADK